MPNAIEARELVKHYPPDVRALDGVTFTVPEGTVFGLSARTGPASPPPSRS